MRRLTVLACLACAPALAAAQTIVVTESNDRDNIINSGECNNNPVDTLAFAWNVASTATTFDLYVSNQAGCPAPGTVVNGVTTNAQTHNVHSGIINQSYNGGETASSLLNAVGIQCSSSSATMFVCVFPNGQTANPVATGSVQLDLVAPAAPVIVAVTGGDSSLNVTWQSGVGSADAGTAGAANSYRVYYVPADGSSGEKYSTFTGQSTTSGRITGLQNGTQYVVQVSALTIGGNESTRSAMATGTPVIVQDFWRLYQNDGGREGGGCATGAAGLAALVALAPLAFRRRRSRP
jgi:Synergist-CTERM protein sorting domain-containing protein